MMMTVEQFIAARQAGWEQLERLTRRARAGQIAALTPAELEDLGRLYRQATADLAQARRDYAGDRLLIYLNRLVAETYPVIYQPEGWNLGRVIRFYTQGFPRLVSRKPRKWGSEPCTSAAAIVSRARITPRSS